MGSSIGSAQARGILAKVKTFKFIGTLHVLSNALAAICECNLIFQADVVDVTEVEKMLKATLDTLSDMSETPGSHTQSFLNILGENENEFQGIALSPTDRDLEQLKSLATRFGENVHTEVQKRFPNEDMQVQKEFATVLDTKSLPPKREKSFSNHGKVELEHLLERYGGEETGVNACTARGQFTHFKNYLAQNREKGLPEMCKLLIDKATYPAFARACRDFSHSAFDQRAL